MLAVAASATRRRFPRVGGFFVWLGHDTFPCAVSLSLLDFDGRIKPAGRALAVAWSEPTGAVGPGVAVAETTLSDSVPPC
jgi:beta-mannosidase